MNNASVDEVLICLNEVYEKDHLKRLTHQEIINHFANKYGKPTSDLVIIIDYLTRTGLVDKSPLGTYIIRYEGKVFIENGGFDGQRRLAKISATKDTLLSLLTASGAVGLCVIEVLRHWNWVGLIDFWTFVAVFLFGLLIGIAALLLVPLIWDRKSKQ